MSTTSIVVPGIVKGGMVMPQSDTSLPEGAHVDILLREPEITPELAAEMQLWESASDEAWALIDEWERDDA